jgi:hypothetical protein
MVLLIPLVAAGGSKAVGRAEWQFALRTKEFLSR